MPPEQGGDHQIEYENMEGEEGEEIRSRGDEHGGAEETGHAHDVDHQRQVGADGREDY